MNIKAVLHAVQHQSHKTTIVRKATKFSSEQRKNTTLSQAVVEIVNDSQNGTPISSSNIMSISANNTCVKEFLDDPLQETFDLFDPTNTLQIKNHNDDGVPRLQKSCTTVFIYQTLISYVAIAINNMPFLDLH